MSSAAFNFATFNTQSLWTDNLKKVSIARDAEKYVIQVVKYTSKKVQWNQARENKKKCIVYHNGIEETNENSEIAKLIEVEIPATLRMIEFAILKYN